MAVPSGNSANGSRLGLYARVEDARRIRAAYSRSSAVLRNATFSEWCIGVLLREAEDIELQENGGRKFEGGEAGELRTGRPATH